MFNIERMTPKVANETACLSIEKLNGKGRESAYLSKLPKAGLNGDEKLLNDWNQSAIFNQSLVIKRPMDTYLELEKETSDAEETLAQAEAQWKEQIANGREMTPEEQEHLEGLRQDVNDLKAAAKLKNWIIEIKNIRNINYKNQGN